MDSIREFYGETTIDEKDSEELNLGEKIKLEYYKTISKLFINEGKETYGIGIVKKCRNNGCRFVKHMSHFIDKYSS